MKKTLLIALLIIPFFGMAQATKPVDGFLGIKFGASKAIVSAAISAKGGALDKKNSEKDLLIFVNVKLGSRKPSLFAVNFVDDKAYQADYIFTPEAEGKLIDNYYDLVKDIANVYGKGETLAKYEDPYKSDDDLSTKIIGLSAGEITLETLWEDPNSKNSVSVQITTDLNIKLTYQSDKLMDIVLAKEKAKQKADF